MINPNAIAAEIIGNCEAYDAGIFNRARWDAEQKRLYADAARENLVSVVLALVLRTSATMPDNTPRGRNSGYIETYGGDRS